MDAQDIRKRLLAQSLRLPVGPQVVPYGPLKIPFHIRERSPRHADEVAVAEAGSFAQPLPVARYYNRRVPAVKRISRLERSRCSAWLALCSSLVVRSSSERTAASSS